MKKLTIRKNRVKITREYILGTEIEVDLNQYIGFQVSIRRKGLKISQGILAEHLGLSRASVTNLEQGRHGIMIKHLQKICELLNCKSSELLPF